MEPRLTEWRVEIPASFGCGSSKIIMSTWEANPGRYLRCTIDTGEGIEIIELDRAAVEKMREALDDWLSCG